MTAPAAGVMLAVLGVVALVACALNPGDDTALAALGGAVFSIGVFLAVPR